MADRRDERFTALPWVGWLSITMIVTTTTNNLWVLVTVVACAAATLAALGGRRAALGRVVVGCSLALIALWAVLGVSIHRPGMGGQVVWFLPTWSAESGGEFGGAVTAGQLHFAAARAVQSAAVVTMLGLVVVAVPPSAWMRLVAPMWGRASAVWSPMLWMGEAYVEQRSERRESRLAGVPAGRSTWVGVTDRARELAGEHAVLDTRRPPWRGTVGWICFVLVAGWWAVSSIDPDPALAITGLERSILAAALLLGLGLVLHLPSGERLPRPTVGDAVPVTGGLAVAAAWYAQGLTGEQALLVTTFDRLPPVPVVLLASLAVLPVLAVIARGRR